MAHFAAATHFHQPSPRRTRRGASLVEFLVVSTFLFVLLFGICEFGMIFRDKLDLVVGARNGARQAALGSPLATIKASVRNTAVQTVTDAQITVEYNSAVDGTGSWLAAADNGTGSANNIPVGSLARVRIGAWPHRMLTGGLFAWLFGVSQGQMNLSAAVVMRRE